MSEKDFALAIVEDYITAWSKFTRAGIGRYLRAISENHPEAQLIQEYDIPPKRQYLEELLPRQFKEMNRQINEGTESQAREIVDWVRKEKIWERNHGWDETVIEGIGRPGEYRHFLPWMEGAKVNPRSSTSPGTANQASADSGAGGLLFDEADYGSWDFGAHF